MDQGKLKLLLNDDPTDAQAADRFVDWLVGNAAGFPPGDEYWLALDGLNKDGAATVRDTLVPQLLKAVANGNLPQVKFFLLGDNGKRVRDARRIVLHEDTASLTAAEVRLFFRDFGAEKGWALSDADLDAMIRDAIGERQPPFDHTAMEEICDGVERNLVNLETLIKASAGAPQ